MRDFLDSVIDRHYDATPQIKPRLPSLFEPEPPQSGTDFGVSGESGIAVQQEEFFVGPSTKLKETAAMPAQSVKASNSTQLTRPPGPPEAEESSLSIGDREISPRPQQRIPEVTVNEWVNPSPGPGGDRTMKLPVTHEEALRKKEGRNDTLPNKSHPQDEQDTIKPRLAARPKWAADPEEKNVPPTSQRLLKEAPARRSVPAHQAEKAAQRSTGIEASSEISPSIQPSDTLIAPVVPPVVRAEKTISQAEPVINVTIGRIEVRATVSTQKHTPKPVNRTPVMGLEEYLRRRSGGRD